jgi:hypothetical protein
VCFAAIIYPISDPCFRTAGTRTAVQNNCHAAAAARVKPTISTSIVCIRYAMFWVYGLGELLTLHSTIHLWKVGNWLLLAGILMHEISRHAIRLYKYIINLGSARVPRPAFNIVHVFFFNSFIYCKPMLSTDHRGCECETRQLRNEGGNDGNR